MFARNPLSDKSVRSGGANGCAHCARHNVSGDAGVLPNHNDVGCARENSAERGPFRADTPANRQIDAGDSYAGDGHAGHDAHGDLSVCSGQTVNGLNAPYHPDERADLNHALVR